MIGTGCVYISRKDCSMYSKVSILEIPDKIKESIEEQGGLEKIKMGMLDKEDADLSSKVFKGLSDPLRVRIVHALSSQPMCVCVIKQILNVSDSKLSYHLSILKESGLIESVHEKNWIIYESTELGRRSCELMEDHILDPLNDRY